MKNLLITAVLLSLLVAISSFSEEIYVHTDSDSNDFYYPIDDLLESMEDGEDLELEFFKPYPANIVFFLSDSNKIEFFIENDSLQVDITGNASESVRLLFNYMKIYIEMDYFIIEKKNIKEFIEKHYKIEGYYVK